MSEGPPGGECTFTGCIPSKTLIAAAARREPFAQAAKLVRSTVAAIARTESEDVLRSEGIRVIRGRATFRSLEEISVDDEVIRGRHFVVATGGGPAVPQMPGIGTIPYLTNEDVFQLDVLPASITVLGGGPIGCELAQAFARFGSTVTLVEREHRLLATEESEVSNTLVDVFRREGIDVRLGSSAVKVERTSSGIGLQLSAGERVQSNALLIATGRKAATKTLGLEAAGVALEPDGFIRTDESLATTAKGIWAAGDVTGRSPFTHAADEMGRIAAANALSRRDRRFDVRAVPFVVFTDPEVARVGCTSADLAGLRGPRIAFMCMADTDRAVTEGSTDGFVKLIGAKRRLVGNVGGGRLVGATVVCARAGELINEAALVIKTGMFLGRIAETIHPYPTWSTAMRQAAAQFFGYGEGVRES